MPVTDVISFSFACAFADGINKWLESFTSCDDCSHGCQMGRGFLYSSILPCFAGVKMHSIP